MENMPGVCENCYEQDTLLPNIDLHNLSKVSPNILFAKLTAHYIGTICNEHHSTKPEVKLSTKFCKTMPKICNYIFAIRKSDDEKQ